MKIKWDRLSRARLTIHDPAAGVSKTPFELEIEDGRGGWRQIYTKGLTLTHEGPIPVVDVKIPLGIDFGSVVWDSVREGPRNYNGMRG